MSIHQDIVNHPAYVRRLRQEGANIAQVATTVPTATVGIFAPDLPAWEPGATYPRQYTLFTYDGKVGFTRQAGITAQAHQPPFSTGMESIYGVRPVPDMAGIYPYTYNMAVKIGMRVREGEAIYRCTKDLDPMLWPPSELAGHFTIGN